MKLSKLSWMFAGLLLVAACGGGPNSDYTDAVPDYDGLALAVSGDAQAPAAEVAPMVEAMEAAQGQSQTPVNYLQQAKDAVEELNGAVKKVTDPLLDLIAMTAKSPSANSRQFGPVTKGDVSYQLTIAKRSDGRWGWRLQAEPAATDSASASAWVTVAAGLVKKGTLPHRGRGVMGVDLDALASVDATFPGAGKLLVGFAHVANTKMLAYRLKGFTPDASVHPPIDAAFVGHRIDPSGKTRVRFAVYANLSGSPDSTTQELVRARVHELPGVGGRAALRVTQGDVPEGDVWLAAACWNAQAQSVYQVVYQCAKGAATADASCTVLEQSGSVSSCDPSLSASNPPVDPTDTTPEPDAPTTQEAPPTIMPTGN